MLEDLGFEWSPQDNSWNDLHRLLVEYEAEHGNCLVPQRYPDNKALGKWVANPADAVPSQKTRGSTASSPRNGSSCLRIWASNGAPRATPGTTSTDSLSNTRPSTGTAWSPSTTPTTRPSGRGLPTQRTQYRLRNEGKHSHLTEERIKLLEDLGFVWSGNGKKKGNKGDKGSKGDRDGEDFDGGTVTAPNIPQNNAPMPSPPNGAAELDIPPGSYFGVPVSNPNLGGGGIPPPWATNPSFAPPPPAPPIFSVSDPGAIFAAPIPAPPPPWATGGPPMGAMPGGPFAGGVRGGGPPPPQFGQSPQFALAPPPPSNPNLGRPPGAPPGAKGHYDSVGNWVGYPISPPVVSAPPPAPPPAPPAAMGSQAGPPRGHYDAAGNWVGYPISPPVVSAPPPPPPFGMGSQNFFGPPLSNPNLGSPPGAPPPWATDPLPLPRPRVISSASPRTAALPPPPPGRCPIPPSPAEPTTAGSGGGTMSTTPPDSGGKWFSAEWPGMAASIGAAIGTGTSDRSRTKSAKSGNRRRTRETGSRRRGRIALRGQSRRLSDQDGRELARESAH